eukprot:SAG31_NODE_31528_length_367_cov_0.753731_2_plen_72_part_01
MTKVVNAHKIRVHFDDGEIHDVSSKNVKLVTEENKSSRLAEATLDNDEDSPGYEARMVVPSPHCGVCIDHFC